MSLEVQRNENVKADKETVTPMIKLFRDIKQREKVDPEKECLLQNQKDERKRRQHSFVSRKSQETSSSEPPMVAARERRAHDSSRKPRVVRKLDDQFKTYYTQEDTSCPPDKRDSVTVNMCQKPKKHKSSSSKGAKGSKIINCSVPSDDDTYSGKSCGLKKIICSEYMSIGVLVVVFTLAVTSAVCVVFNTLPATGGGTEDDMQSKMLASSQAMEKIIETTAKSILDNDFGIIRDRGVKQIDLGNDWEDTMTKSLNELQALTPQRFNYLDPGLGTVKRKREDIPLSLHMAPTSGSDQLKNFYRKLVETDSKINNLRKVHDNQNSEFNRVKRSLKHNHLRPRYRRKHHQKNKRQIQNENYKEPTGFVIEKKKLVIHFEPEQIKKKFPKCSHFPKQEIKTHEHVMKHPFYKNTQRLDELLDQFIYQNVPDIIENPFAKEFLGMNKPKYCKHFKNFKKPNVSNDVRRDSDVSTTDRDNKEKSENNQIDTEDLIAVTSALSMREAIDNMTLSSSDVTTFDDSKTVGASEIKLYGTTAGVSFNVETTTDKLLENNDADLILLGKVPNNRRLLQTDEDFEQSLEYDNVEPLEVIEDGVETAKRSVNQENSEEKSEDNPSYSDDSRKEDKEQLKNNGDKLKDTNTLLLMPKNSIINPDRSSDKTLSDVNSYDYFDSGSDKMAQAYSDYGVLEAKKDVEATEKKNIYDSKAPEYRRSDAETDKKASIWTYFTSKLRSDTNNDDTDIRDRRCKSSCPHCHGEGFRIKMVKDNSASNSEGDKTESNKDAVLSADKQTKAVPSKKKFRVSNLFMDRNDDVKDTITVTKDTANANEDNSNNHIENFKTRSLKFAVENIDGDANDYDKNISKKEAANILLVSNESTMVENDNIESKIPANNVLGIIADFFFTLSKMSGEHLDIDTAVSSNFSTTRTRNVSATENFPENVLPLNSTETSGTVSPERVIKSRKLMSIEGSFTTENLTESVTEEIKSTNNVTSMSTPIPTAAIPLTRDSLTILQRPKSLVKRQAQSSDENLVFWDDIYDDEYGVKDAEDPNARKRSTDKPDAKTKADTKTSRNWFREKFRKVLKAFRRNTDRNVAGKGLKDLKESKRVQRSVYLDDEEKMNEQQKEEAPEGLLDSNDLNAPVDNFEELSKKLDAVVEKAAKTVLLNKKTARDTKLTSETDASDSLMHQLLNMMSELVDTQVQERTCLKLPPDLRAFLQWLTGSKDSGVAQRDSWQSYLPVTEDNLQFDSNYRMTESDLAGVVASSTSANVAEQSRTEPNDLKKQSDVFSALQSVQALMEDFNRLPNEERNKMVAAKEYLGNQMDYLYKLIIAEDQKQPVLRKRRQTEKAASRIKSKSETKHSKLAKYFSGTIAQTTIKTSDTSNITSHVSK